MQFEAEGRQLPLQIYVTRDTDYGTDRMLPQRREVHEFCVRALLLP
jgi:hypothetical protein